MISLCIRTDKPEAELYLYKNEKELGSITWRAHRELSDTLHRKIDEITQDADVDLEEVKVIVVYKGPGSFTGLRIGFAVANALAYALPAKVIAINGKNWLKQGIETVNNKKTTIVKPYYGGAAHTTKPKK